MEVDWFQQASSWDFEDKEAYRVISYPKPSYFARADIESTLFLAPNNARDWLNVFVNLVQDVE
jgi:hypothetical protein